MRAVPGEVPLSSAPRAVLLCANGMYQRFLAQRLAAELQLVGLAVRVPKAMREPLAWRAWRRLRNRSGILSHVRDRWALKKYEEAAQPTIEDLFYKDGHAPAFPGCMNHIEVEDVNCGAVVDLISGLEPDIVCDNGTNLIRGRLLEVASSAPMGLVNLHSGLSPYTRGGNCNLFALKEGRPEWVGMTVHYIDQGIDSGDIILSQRPRLDVSDSYEMIEAKSFALGIEMMVKAVRQISQGVASREKQWGGGRLYLKRTGYVYSPRERLIVNRMLEAGLIADYLRDRLDRDRNIRLVGTPCDIDL